MTNFKGTVNPIKDHVLVVKMEQGEKITNGGIIVLDDNGKENGIKARWCQIWKVGPLQSDVSPGEWALVDHGRWTRGFTTEDELDEDGKPLYIQRVDVKDIMMVSTNKPF